MILGSVLPACILVGVLWGATNPLIKRGSVLVESKKSGAQGWLAEWRALLTTPSFLVPQLLNQSGGALFIFLLGGADISTAVPVANATSLAGGARSMPGMAEHACQHQQATPRTLQAPQRCCSMTLHMDCHLSHSHCTRSLAAANAVVGVLLGEQYRLAYLLPGLALVAAGLLLCTLN